MSKKAKIIIHDIRVDGLPKDDQLDIAFLFDGCITSGWPLDVELHGSNDDGTPYWEGNSDVSHGRMFASVTHWVEFVKPVWRYEEGK